MTKYWSALLSEWRARGRDGFTLPFIIGSQKFLNEKANLQSIRDLLIDIVDSDSPQVYIKYCITTEEIILGIYDEKRSNLLGAFPTSDGHSQQQLFLTAFLNDLGVTVEEIIQSLTDKYQPHIDRGDFSKHSDRTWGNFDRDDVAFIRSTFMVKSK